MSKIRNKNTKPEKAVRKIFHKLNIKYNIHTKILPGTPDTAISETKKLFL